MELLNKTVTLHHVLSSFQKPIMLHGHERSITQIKYNREGDLIFSAAKDSQPNVWYSLNGERLGTFVGHNGAVWCIDCNCILHNQSFYFLFFIFFIFYHIHMDRSSVGLHVVSSKYIKLLPFKISNILLAC